MQNWILDAARCCFLHEVHSVIYEISLLQPGFQFFRTTTRHRGLLRGELNFKGREPLSGGLQTARLLFLEKFSLLGRQ